MFAALRFFWIKILTKLNLVYIALVIMGCVNAYKEKEPELPVVGGIAKSIFGKQIDAE